MRERCRISTYAGPRTASLALLSVTAVVRAHPLKRTAHIRPQRAALLFQPVADRPRRRQLEEERRHLPCTRRRLRHRRRRCRVAAAASPPAAAPSGGPEGGAGSMPRRRRWSPPRMPRSCGHRARAAADNTEAYAVVVNEATHFHPRGISFTPRMAIGLHGIFSLFFEV